MKYLENVDNEPSERCFNFGDVPDYRLESFLHLILFTSYAYIIRQLVARLLGGGGGQDTHG